MRTGFRLRARGRWAIVAAVAAAVCLASAAARAEHILGKVTGFENLRNPVWEEASQPKHHGYFFRELVPTVPPRFRNLFPHIPKELCIAAIGTTNQPKVPPVLVRVGGGRTTPVTIVVPPGTQLTFQNTDPFTHRIYGVGIKTFPPAETQKGATRDWTVSEAGVFQIRDELAPSVRMWVVAHPKVAAIAYPSMDGAFRLKVPAAGEYTLQAYFAGEEVGSPLPITIVQGRDIDLGRAPISVAPKKKKSQ